MDHEGMGIEGFIHHVGSCFWFFLKCDIWFLHIYGDYGILRKGGGGCNV